MGGEESRPTYKRDFFVDFPTRYKPLKNISDNFYGSGTLYLKHDKSLTVYFLIHTRLFNKIW